MDTLANKDAAITDTAYPRPPMSLIERGVGPHRVDLYIGDTEAARDLRLLRKQGINLVINCAINLDINYVVEPLEAPATGKFGHGSGPVRTYKLGLVDGPGNPDHMMLASYLLLDSAIRQELPDKPSYPHREHGNVLVHCRGGRSRSVALVALFLHLSNPRRYPTLDDAIALVRQRRALHPDEWFETPKPVLIEAARKAARAAQILTSS